MVNPLLILKKKRIRVGSLLGFPKGFNLNKRWRWYARLLASSISSKEFK